MLATWSHESYASVLGAAWRSPRIRIVALSIASVPFLHLYLQVELTPLELLVHALDVGLGVALACAFSHVAVGSAGAASEPAPRGRPHWRYAARAMLAAALFLVAFEGLLPGSDAIRERHHESGYGDMWLRLVPLAGLLAYLAWSADRRTALHAELLALRAANARLATPRLDSPVPAPAELGPGTAPAVPPAPAAAPLALAHDDGVLLIAPGDVLRVQAMENYCEFTLRAPQAAGSTRRVLLRMTLSEARRKLPSDRFVKAHRSHLVQLDGIRAIAREGRRLWLDLGDAGRVPLARSQRDALLARIEERAAGSTARSAVSTGG